MSGVLPGWPGADVYPVQPMVSQTRGVLDRYASAGGSDGSVMNVFVRHRDRTGVTAFVVPRDSPGLRHQRATTRQGDA